MTRYWTGRTLKPIQFGLVTSILVSLAVFLVPQHLLEGPRERFFDTLTQWGKQASDPSIVVVDVDRKAIGTLDGRNWDRTDWARLLNAIASRKPAAVALDFVLSANCGASSANDQLAKALGQLPSVLGFLLSDQHGPPMEARLPVIAGRGLKVPPGWFINGVEGACPAFAAKAAASAGAFLLGDADARVRRVQAYSILDGAGYPALPLAAVMVAKGSGSPPVLEASPFALRLGPSRFSLGEDGELRFVAANADTIAARTVSAADVLSAGGSSLPLTGKIVFVGSSLPSLGGLRATASMPLEPSVQIAADLASGLLQGALPHRMPGSVRYEALLVLAAGIAISLAAARFRPSGLAALGGAIVLATLVLAFGLYAATGLLVDGFSAALALVLVLIVVTYFQFARVRAAERKARARFGQYLPQAVVDRYLDGEERGRLAGEMREVTALFTDIEGFSALTKRLETKAMVALLDVYFADVNACVAAHGGMVDKVVGDAVHALFNAPEDLENHVDRAIDCALKIRTLTEAMRLRPEFLACDFGRTRIGLETGPAILGEVGAGGRLDYTAHGPAINLAARLQDANKQTGTSILIGPAAAALASHGLLPLGERDIRDFGMLQLFTI